MGGRGDGRGRADARGAAPSSALAVWPGDRENVLGATTQGLYQRVRGARGAVTWARRREGVHSSVVAASHGGTARAFAAEWGRGVFHSSDGSAWARAGTGFPAGAGRIALAVRPDDPDLVYAAVADARGALLGLWRLGGVGAAWKEVSGLPPVLPTSGGRSQGDYDLAIAVDPRDANRVYLGGSYVDAGNYPASIWRCDVRPSGSGWRATGVSIGEDAHADVHVLVHAPGDADVLWTGCDGGAFVNRDPRRRGRFESRNDGLSCLCTNFFGQHPTDPAILFTGLQDNGTARTAGEQAWTHVNGGDGGYCVVNAADPRLVLVYANGRVYRATDGGLGHDSWTEREFPWSMMTEPIVAPPFDPADPASARLVAIGVGTEIHFSRDFGGTWPDAETTLLPARAGVFSLAFASSTRLFAGTAAGEVFRLDRGRERLDGRAPRPRSGGPARGHGARLGRRGGRCGPAARGGLRRVRRQRRSPPRVALRRRALGGPQRVGGARRGRPPRRRAQRACGGPRRARPPLRRRRHRRLALGGRRAALGADVRGASRRAGVRPADPPVPAAPAGLAPRPGALRVAALALTLPTGREGLGLPREAVH